MKFIAGLRVWVNGVTGKIPQVFPRFSGSANRRVDLHLPLIASILGRRHGALKSLADRRRRGAKTAKPLLERNRSAVGKTKAPLVAGGPQQLTPPTPQRRLLPGLESWRAGRWVANGVNV